MIDARGEPGAGTIGDILAARALARGATGIVTDGGLRDSQTVAELDIPIYFQNPHAAVLGLKHFPLEANVPVACGGVLVMPGDVVVGDAEGVVVVPAALAEEVARDADAQEDQEEWALERVQAGRLDRRRVPARSRAAGRVRSVARARAAEPLSRPRASALRGSDTCGLVARGAARTRCLPAVAQRRERLAGVAESSSPSSPMTHFAGTGLVSANAASTSAWRS